jgi:DNA modification methylase
MSDKADWDRDGFKAIMGTMGSVTDIGFQDREKHPHEKPVKLWKAFLAGFAKETEIYEPFLGSGAMLIAGEMMGRSIYAVELMPELCDAAITRWEKFTDRTAEKIG